MAKVFIEETTLTAIGNAIRGKTGKTELIDPANMSTEIASIEAGGGGGGDLPEEAFTWTGSISYKGAYNHWNWFLETYSPRITTSGLDGTEYCFYNSDKLTTCPQQFNVTNGYKFSYSFSGCKKLTTCPKIRGTLTIANGFNCGDMLKDCRSLRDIEDLFLPEMLDGVKDFKVTSTSGPRFPTFYNMYSLRRIPSWWYKCKVSPESTSYISAFSNLYRDAFQYCITLDEARNIPVVESNTAAQTSDMFSNTFTQCNRVNAITFETNEDGSPIEVKWKSQTINLTAAVGYRVSLLSDLYNYNSGITLAKQIKDDATYQALKNDPDCWASERDYSRYNHDSAVETINSLPDTSAYLTEAGGTNTIKFTGAAGSATDGGAINTLTEAEIAVATAKGWTVTFV
jgi:hypothetical protein